MAKQLENFHFLIVEDDEVDILALKRILVEIDRDIAFSIAHDGVQALEMIHDDSENSLKDETLIILLDLNMPRMDGHEFLEKLRADPATRNTVVFVLSTSSDSRDINKSYQHHVSGYIPKERLTADNFRTLIEGYLALNEFPGTR